MTRKKHAAPARRGAIGPPGRPAKAKAKADAADGAGPRERIEEATVRLFYSRGYHVPLEELMEEAGAYRKSLYRYFPDRRDLGRAYLERQSERFVGLLRTLTERHDRFDDFWRAWMRIVRSQARAGLYRGCPFAGFAGQTLTESEAYADDLRQAMALWLETMERFLERAFVADEQGDAPAQGTRAQGPPRSRCRRMAEQVLAAFEGASAMHLLTGDIAYFEKMEVDVPILLRATALEDR